MLSGENKVKGEIIVEEDRGQRALKWSGTGSLSQVEETGTGRCKQKESSTSETSHNYFCFVLVFY